jgi:hypothetical protein
MIPKIILNNTKIIDPTTQTISKGIDECGDINSDGSSNEYVIIRYISSAAPMQKYIIMNIPVNL